MPQQKDLKRRVRARMAKTGEAYTTARSRILAKRRPPAAVPEDEWPALAGTSDEAVRRRTGRTWAQWVRVLDDVNAASMPHRDIARHVQDEHGIDGWWAQTVTVGYERIRGLRAKGQRRGGGFDVNKSKTLPVPVDELYAAFGARRRRRWLGDAELRIRTATPSRSMRIAWGDGTAVDACFWEKGPAKSQVQLQHRGHPTKESADEVRAFWTERLKALADYLGA